MTRRLSKATSAVVDELRWLVSFAPRAGADGDRVAVIAESLIDLILDSQDQRSVRALQVARRVRKARDAGVSIAELTRRFGRSRSQIHRLLRSVA